ncbi:MAG TPA: hypothetical protein PKA64_25915 [Myxococcota bacterium]|nr:hypothetical protein [Myxococcota bacterium]
MDFQRVDERAGVVCAVCGASPSNAWYQINGRAACPACTRKMQADLGGSAPLLRWVPALALGGAAALLGATGYGAIMYYARVEASLVTIFIGWMVGRAVLIGAGYRGGLGLQIAAALLTWLGCTLAFVPVIVEGGAGEGLEAGELLLGSALIAPALPFLGDLDVLSLIILGFGVWQGFRGPAAVDVQVEGPFYLSGSGA